MKARQEAGRGLLLRWLAAGALVFAAGAALALALLPEWSSPKLRGQRSFQAQYLRLAHQAGFQVATGEPRINLVTGALAPARTARPWEEPRTGLGVEVRHSALFPGVAGTQVLRILFSPDGKPLRVDWENPAASLFAPPNPALYDRLAEDLSSLLVAPGESVGGSLADHRIGFASRRRLDLAGSSPGQHLAVNVEPPYGVSARRLPGRLKEVGPSENKIGQGLTLGLVNLVIFMAVVGIFLSLLLRGRIDLTNGAILALITLLSANVLRLLDLEVTAWVSWVTLLSSAPGRALWVFLVWSAGESLLRSLRPDFTTSLDTLRLGRLGPRGGRALLLGFACGAILAGLQLGLHALAALLPGLSPAGPSLSLPIFDLDNSPVGSGISTAAVTALALALALRFLPERWVLPAAALLTGYVLSPLQIRPFPVELAANALAAGLLVWTCRRHGLTALLAAAVTAFLLPAVLFSALHAGELPGSFALTAGLTGLLLALGFAGVSRPAEIETGEIPPPAFMRRLAHERRLQHEVDLLARMQVGLLPQEMPRVEGYEIAARSVLASEAGGDLYDFLRDEAGGLWIAAGDVAGHGYSCAVAQAMIKAGLLSLIEPGETPAGVLRQLDRVLRGVSTDHRFTSLALIRLDPAASAPADNAVLGNAGHPYPLVFAAGRVSEIELPSLPLGTGRGPAGSYQDRAFELPRGGALLLCSNGLFEAMDKNGNAYGFDRAREVFQAMGHRPAVEIVDALMNDCRRHLEAEQPPDDVTVVVVKRCA